MTTNEKITIIMDAAKATGQSYPKRWFAAQFGIGVPALNYRIKNPGSWPLNDLAKIEELYDMADAFKNAFK